MDWVQGSGFRVFAVEVQAGGVHTMESAARIVHHGPSKVVPVLGSYLLLWVLVRPPRYDIGGPT